jgi:hypothetical protein
VTAALRLVLPAPPDGCGTQADFTTLWAPVCARRKIPPNEYTTALAAKVQVSAPWPSVCTLLCSSD